MESLTMACLRKDCAYVTGWILGRFQISLTYDQVQEILSGVTGYNPIGWGDSSWTSWLKIKLTERHYFPVGSRKDFEYVPTAQFHIFFTQLEETPEMLALLPERGKKQTSPNEARSKIFQTEQIPRPIDAVAQRVSNITSFLKKTE